MTGWECPRCGRCYAPHIEKCSECWPRVQSQFGDLSEAKNHICTPDPNSTARVCSVCGKSVPWTSVISS